MTSTQPLRPRLIDFYFSILFRPILKRSLNHMACVPSTLAWLTSLHPAVLALTLTPLGQCENWPEPLYFLPWHHVSSAVISSSKVDLLTGLPGKGCSWVSHCIATLPFGSVSSGK